MTVLIVGGGLQGLEAAYLAKKAGWKTILVDKKSKVPAKDLTDIFIQSDVSDIHNFKYLLSKYSPVDLIIPACENLEALVALNEWSLSSSIPFAFDINAYHISSSKLKSDRLFASLKLPAPRPWPHSEFPIIIKPNSSSGSRGVKRYDSLIGLKADYPEIETQISEGLVMQEFITGPACSLEIVGHPGHYLPLQVTQLHMDKRFDCMRVTAPVDLDNQLIAAFETMAITLASEINLHGIMDIEVILHKGQLKLLEIDARLPSQTPVTVFHSTGVNMLELLYQSFHQPGTFSVPPLFNQRAVIYEHIRVSGKEIE